MSKFRSSLMSLFFRYLREFILCNADTTLEESYLIVHENGFKEHGATGMDMIHRCKDWTTVRDYLEDNFTERLAKGSGKHPPLKICLSRV